MSNLTKLAERLAPGVTLVCVENTYRPARNGARQTVQRVVAGRADCVTPDGRRVWVNLPAARRDMQWLDNDTAQWNLRLGNGRAFGEGHTVTYRIER